MSELALRRNTNIPFNGTTSGFSKVLDWFSVNQPDRTGADILDTHEMRKISASVKYPVWNFTVNNKPLSAVVQYEEAFWFAEVDWLNVIGEGQSPEEAMRDLESQIDHFITFYNDQEPDQLTEYANKLKAKFSTLVHL